MKINKGRIISMTKFLTIWFSIVGIAFTGFEYLAEGSKYESVWEIIEYFLITGIVGGFGIITVHHFLTELFKNLDDYCNGKK